jgi:hypothetical protein
MSEAIVVARPTSAALQRGGVGLGTPIFRPKTAYMELVQKTSRQENVKFGEFRDISTNEHFGSVIRVVLMGVPQEQREWFEGADFKASNKQCFSIDGITPHGRAQNPPAMFCKTCPKGDLNWITWRKTKDAKDLPPCGAFWHLHIATRTTQKPYFINVKGTSYKPFKDAMETKMAGILSSLMANVKAENKKRGYTLINLQDGENGPVYQEFRPTPGFTLPEGVTEQQKPEAFPNIFDVSFDMIAASKNGGPYVMSFQNFKYMNAEDRAEFGSLYLDIMQQKQEAAEQYAENIEAEAERVVTEPAASTATQPVGEVLPPITI